MSSPSKHFDSKALPRSVFIFGCGYIGSVLAEVLISRGVRVGALTRNSETAEHLRRMDVLEVIEGRLHESHWQRAVTGVYEGVVNCVSSAGGGIEGYRLSYLEGQRRILEWVAKASMKPVYVYTSSTSVYPQTDGVLVDEAADVTDASATGKVLLESEVCVAEAASFLTSWYILRLAGIYGPGRHHLLDQLRDGDGVISGRGDYMLNLVHRDDVVAAILYTLSGLSNSGVYNICDDAPEPKESVLGYLAEEIGLPVPRFDPEQISPRLKRRGGIMPDRVISNSKAREILGWAPRYPSFRDGYVNLLENYDS